MNSIARHYETQPVPPHDAAAQRYCAKARCRIRALKLLVTVFPILLIGSRLLAGEPSDLALGNFLSAGWNDTWTRRSRGDETPDLALLRVQTNFLVRLSRTGFAIQQNTGAAPFRQSGIVRGEVVRLLKETKQEAPF